MHHASHRPGKAGPGGLTTVESLELIRLATGAASTVLYTLVGVTVGRRRASADAVLGIRAFQAWWFGLAGVTLFNPMMTLLDLLPDTGQVFLVRLFLLETVIVVLIGALGGLLYYLLYVYSGQRWVGWLVGAYAFLELAALLTLIAYAHPTDYGPGCPSGGFCYELDVSGTPASRIVSYTISVPLLLATGAYFALFFRVEGVQRLRVAMVASSLALWFGAGLIAGLIPVASGQSLNQTDAWRFVISPLISLSASLVILWAYRLRGDSVGSSRVPAGGR